MVGGPLAGFSDWENVSGEDRMRDKVRRLGVECFGGMFEVVLRVSAVLCVGHHYCTVH